MSVSVLIEVFIFVVIYYCDFPRRKRTVAVVRNYNDKFNNKMDPY